MLSEISQNSLKTPVATRVSFFAEACNFIKKDTLVQVFSCEFCDNSKNTFFAEHIWVTASAQIDPGKIVKLFEHYTDKFLVQFWLGQMGSKQCCICLFSCDKMTKVEAAVCRFFSK